MPPKRRRFERPIGERRYRKFFILAVEGTNTEPQYFSFFNSENSVINVKCLKGNKASSPPQVLKRMEEHLKRKGLKQTDEAWLVVDKDQWTDDQLKQLYRWSKKKSNYGFALSNPKFEYWLLLHFEDCNGVSSSRTCSDKLEKYLPNYRKNIDVRKITESMIMDAIRRSRNKDNPPCSDWPRKYGTTIYILVESILRSKERING